MSELKTYDFPVDHVDFTTTIELFYLKSDVDKVIAELKSDYKEACDRLQTANLIKDEQLAATRNHKYKRCLAMAKWCASRSASWCLDPADDELHKSDFSERARSGSSRLTPSSLHSATRRQATQNAGSLSRTRKSASARANPNGVRSRAKTTS